MDWAEDEIAKAQRRHAAQAAVLWTKFRIMVPTQDLMRTEFVCRSHCRELLERVVTVRDTETTCPPGRVWPLQARGRGQTKQVPITRSYGAPGAQPAKPSPTFDGRPIAGGPQARAGGGHQLRIDVDRRHRSRAQPLAQRRGIAPVPVSISSTRVPASSSRPARTA